MWLPYAIQLLLYERTSFTQGLKNVMVLIEVAQLWVPFEGLKRILIATGVQTILNFLTIGTEQ